jgi:DMSO/TMAO reductase YedYZ molybdopterin-dependent catalytic subunit
LNKDSKTSTPLIIASVMVVIVAIYGVSQFNRLGQTDYVEIRDYQGVRLSSINDFRENSIRGPQEINVTDYRLKIFGEVENPTEYTYFEVLDNFTSQRKVVTLNCVEGWSATVLWEGVKIMDLVREADPSEEAVIIIFHAEDGYTTSLPIEYIRNNELILAYKINEVTLPEENGFPLQLVAESKWGFKWCRWVTGLEFSSDAGYEGYWEQRGYSNSADLDESFWEN